MLLLVSLDREKGLFKITVQIVIGFLWAESQGSEGQGTRSTYPLIFSFSSYKVTNVQSCSLQSDDLI